MPPLLLYLVTVTIWGSTWYAITFQLGDVHPAVSVAYRFSLAAAILVALCVVTRRSLRFGARQHEGVALLGTFLFSTNYIVFYFATGYLTSGLIALVFSTIIAMNIVLGALLFGQPIDKRVVMGSALGLCGMALVFAPELHNVDVAEHVGLGVGLSLVGTLLASLGNMASVYIGRLGVPVLQGNALGMCYGAAVNIVVVLILGAEVSFERTWSYTLSLGYLALFGSVFAFGCYLTLINRIGPDRGAYAGVMFPIVALAISTVFEYYTWSVLALTGAALIVAGNVLVLRRRQPSATPS